MRRSELRCVRIGGRGRGSRVARKLRHITRAITAVDDQIGRLVKALDGSGFRDDTILMVSSDHGDMLGSQGLRLKRKPWEESIRVPGLFATRDRLNQASASALFSHIDFVPTMLGLCGVKQPRQIQGIDFSGYLCGRYRENTRFGVLSDLWSFPRRRNYFSWRGVRTDRYMYARAQDSAWVLYDLKKDPFEMTNLVKQILRPSRLRKCWTSGCREWMKATGDSWKFNWTTSWRTTAGFISTGRSTP